MKNTTGKSLKEWRVKLSDPVVSNHCKQHEVGIHKDMDRQLNMKHHEMLLLQGGLVALEG